MLAERLAEHRTRVGAALALRGDSHYHQFEKAKRQADYGHMALIMACASHCEYRSSGQPWVRTSRS
jgi:hypothetical protein